MKEIKGIPVSRNCLNTLLISDDKGIMSNWDELQISAYNLTKLIWKDSLHILLYGCKNWTMKVKDETQITATETRPTRQMVKYSNGLQKKWIHTKVTKNRTYIGQNFKTITGFIMSTECKEKTGPEQVSSDLIGGVRQSLGTAAWYRHIVLAPVCRVWWNIDGMIIGGDKPEENPPQCHFVHHNFHMDCLGIEPGPKLWCGFNIAPLPWMLHYDDDQF